MFRAGLGTVSTMNISGRVARPLLASIFISAGLDAFQHPENKAKAAEKVTRPLSEHIDFLPEDPVTLVRINGAVQVAAGMLLSFGILRRTAAVLLIGSLVPTTVAAHPFWEDLDEDVRAQHLTQFFKNLGLLGGLVLVATEGRQGSNRRARARAQGSMVRARSR
jgi:uncharacterized membrane protein YphA (DoxX/SURF4 family)